MQDAERQGDGQRGGGEGIVAGAGAPAPLETHLSSAEDGVGGPSSPERAGSREASPAGPAGPANGHRRQLPDGWTTIHTDKLMRKCQGVSGDDFPPETMIRRLQHSVQQHGDRVVFRQLPDAQTGADPLEVTYEALGNQVRKCAQALIKAGVRLLDKVCIAGAGSPTWAVAYLGTMSAGAIPCTLFPNDTIDSILSLAQRCGARALLTAEVDIANAFVSSLGRSELPDLEFVVVWDEAGRSAARHMPEAHVGRSGWKGLFRWRDLLEPEAGPDVRTEHDRRAASVLPGTCASIVLTPGTSGEPKAVMLSHDNWSWTAQTVATQIGMTSADHLLACLPIASATGQLLFIHVALVAGCAVTFPPVLPGASQDGLARGASWDEIYVRACRMSETSRWHQHVVAMLKATRPTILVGCGCLWEIIASVVRTEIQAAQGTTAKKFAWALQQGKDAGMRLQGTGSTKSADVGSKGMSWGVAKRVMFQKIWNQMGLERCRYAAGVGSYRNADAIELLLNVGLPVLWMYGSAESSGMAALSSSSKAHNKMPGFRIGYSGRALKGTALMLRRRTGSSNVGAHLLRICVKGRNVMMGYLDDAARTAAALDLDGTLRTDDCGEMDYGTQLLHVEAQESAIMRLSTDTVVTASRVEDAMRKELPLLSNVVAVADGFPFVVCLLSLETQPLGGAQSVLSPDVKNALQELDVRVDTVEEARHNAKLTERIILGVQQVNLALGPAHAPVKRFFILSQDLRIENGELTPAMTLRRRVIIEKYADIIEDIYDDSLPEERKKRRRNGGPYNGEGAPADEGARAEAAVVPRDMAAAQVRSGEGEVAAAERGSELLPARSRSPAEHVGCTTGAVERDISPGQGFAALAGEQEQVDEKAAEEAERQVRVLAPVEAAVLRTNPAISNVMVVGEEGPFLSCLISLKTVSAGDYALHPDGIAAARAFDSASVTVMEAKDDARFRALLVDSIARVNQQMGHPELAIKKFIILLDDFLPALAKTQGPSAVTPLMRQAVKRRFDKVIRSIYAGHLSPHGTPLSQFGGVVSASLNQTRSPSGFQEALPDQSWDARGSLVDSQAGGADSARPCHDADASSNLRDHSTFDKAVPQHVVRTSAGNADAVVAPSRSSLIPQPAVADNLASVQHDFVNGNRHGHGSTDGMARADRQSSQDPQAVGRKSEELVQLVLDMDMAHVLPRMQAFCAGLHADVYRALDVERQQVVVRNVSAGSVIVNVALLAGESPSDDSHSPLALVRMLQEQALDSSSVLRQGAYTRALVSVRHLPRDSADDQRTGDKENVSQQTVPRACGVGLVLQAQVDGRVVIARIVPGSPAALTRELCQGDMVAEVDGQPLTGGGGEDAADAVIAALQGPKGSLVRMAVMRGDLSHTVYMVRGGARDRSISTTLGNGAGSVDGAEQLLRDAASGPQQPPAVTPALGVSDGIGRRSRVSGVGLPMRLSTGTPGSVLSSPSVAADGVELKRTLQVCTACKVGLPVGMRAVVDTTLGGSWLLCLTGRWHGRW